MTEQDIRGAMLSIVGSLKALEGIEKRMSRGTPQATDTADAAAQKENIVECATNLGAQLLVDINRIADALEFVAKQHNSSEALFRA